MLMLVQVAIALVLVYMLMGLLATSVQETLAQAFKLRGRLLRGTLRRMLTGGADNTLFARVYNHALVGGSPVARLPSHVSAANFSMALADVLTEGEARPGIEGLEAAVHQLPEGPARQSLMAFLNNADGNVGHFLSDVRAWYNEVMARASEIYKSRCHLVVFFCGLVLAVSLNVDTIRITQTLLMEQVLRARMSETATAVQASGGQNGDLLREERADVRDAGHHVKMAADQLFKLGLPIGWLDLGPVIITDATVQQCPLHHPETVWARVSRYFCVRGWAGGILTAIGWLLTAIASAFGAPFWFHMLQRLLPPLRGDKAGISDSKT